MLKGLAEAKWMPCHSETIFVTPSESHSSSLGLGNLLCQCQFWKPLTLFKVKSHGEAKKLSSTFFSFGLYCAITIAFHLQACYIYTGLVLHSDEVLVIVGFVVLSNGQFVVLLVSLGLPCIYSDFQACVGSLVLLWFVFSRGPCVCGLGIHPCETCLHVCEASLTSHVTSHTGRVKTRWDLDKGKTTNLPQGIHSFRWSCTSSACLIKGVFTQRRHPRTRDVSPRSHHFIILLFTTILSEEYTSTQEKSLACGSCSC